YAAMWQHRRYPWKVESGGSGSGVHKSTDGGATWEELSEGLPEAMGKIGISVSRANPQRVYAVIEAEGEKGGVYRSDDGGKKWAQTSTDRITIARAWYYIEIFADPVDEETVYVLNAPFLKSIDGGKTFTPIPVPHGDTHDHWINPNNNQVMINANDGGGCISFNGGRTWSSQQNQPTAQFYRVITDHQFPYYVYGGQQDNSSMAIASRTNFIGIGWKDWFAAAGGESAYLAFDPENPEVLYGSSIQGFITRYHVKTEDNKSIQVYPELALGMAPKDMKYRYNWNPPLVANPLGPSTMYFGAQKVLKTIDEGTSWEEISPDLTRNQIERQGKGGGPFTNEAAGGENYNTIMYITPSTHESGTIWVGTDDGLVHLTRDEGKNWHAVTPEGLPEMIINSIEISPHDPATAYIVGIRYKFDDHQPYIYKTDNYGQSWIPIVNGIGSEDFVRAVREDPHTEGILYAGTERGLYISFDQGRIWHKLQLNLPAVPINDLIIQDNDLVAATAGRGFWILEDLGAIQQSKGVFPTDKPRLFQPKQTVKFTAGGFASIRFPNMGQNPMNGVLIDYYLPEDMDSMEVRLEVLDPSDKPIKTYTNEKDDAFKPYPGGPPPPDQLPSKKGLNRYAWDFRTDRLPNIPGEYIMGDYRGHQVAPGTYKLKLVAEDDSMMSQVQVIPDPRLKSTKEDFDNQQQMLGEIDQLIEDIHQSINKMRKVKEQMGQWNKHLKEKKELDTLIHLGDTIMAHIIDWEKNLLETKHQTQQDVVNFESRLSAEFMFLKNYIDSHDPQITAGARERFQDLKKEWEAQKLVLHQLINNEVANYNKLYREKEVPAVVLD
ncbi:MAG: glycosyl hydrolase, partial [Cyclobacteriaceae bacterium]|nr:glycosyl hydrolase [Cyclobacteriaceae bacterium]